MATAAEASDAGLSAELERFVYEEAGLLDERAYEAWLGLLAADVTYWLPNFDEDGPPRTHGVIVLEHLQELRARVARALDARNPTQQPPARTRHFLTNVIVERGEDGATAGVRASLLLYVSKGGQLSAYPGKCTYALRREAAGWRIVAKTINLLANDAPLISLPIV
jgi:3-phenylpropionate/cinnamic acid dioxygenase small subunit